MMGQQVMVLGLSCKETFVPLDSEPYISGMKAMINRAALNARLPMADAWFCTRAIIRLS